MSDDPVSDTPLSAERLNEERAFIKRYTEGLAKNKVEYPADFSTPAEDRPRKVPVVNVPVAEPPEVMDVDSGPLQDSIITLTIKSLKPAFTLSVPASLTDPISALKTAIASRQPSAPPPAAQRLLLKGKALADTKLLKEYDLADGAVVHLMTAKPTEISMPSSAAAAGAGAGTGAVAASSGSSDLTSTTSPSGSGSAPAPPQLTITTSVPGPSPGGPDSTSTHTVTQSDIDLPPHGPGPEITSASFHRVVADPRFWQKIHALCATEFDNQDEADEAWEAMFVSLKGKMSAGEVAKVRDVVGVIGEPASDTDEGVADATRFLKADEDRINASEELVDLMDSLERSLGYVATDLKECGRWNRQLEREVEEAELPQASDERADIPMLLTAAQELYDPGELISPTYTDLDV